MTEIQKAKLEEAAAIFDLLSLVNETPSLDSIFRIGLMGFKIIAEIKEAEDE